MRGNRRRRRMGLALAVGLACLASLPVAANGWAWSSHVTLQGSVECRWGLAQNLTGLYLSASNGEKGWATLEGTGYKRKYSYRFTNVPSSGMSVTASVGCKTLSYKTTFGVQRPAIGTTATRHIWP